MVRVLLLGSISLLLIGCEVDFAKPKAPDPELAQRLARKKSELLQKPQDVETLLALGTLQVEAGQMFEAADNFAAARKLGSQDIRINAGLTAAYFELGYVRTGIDELKGCLEKDRSNAECLFAYGKLIETDQSPRARAELKTVWLRFLEVAPQHRQANYVRSSLEQIEAQLASAPQQPQSQLPPGHAQVAEPPGDAPADVPADAPIPGHPGGTPEQDQEIGELNAFGQAIARAIEAVKKQDAPAAEAAFRDALKISPDDPSALAGLSETLFAQNKQADAVATIEKAYEKDPKDAQVRWAFGLIMMRNQKRMPEAIKAWEDLNHEDPDYAKKLGIPQRLEGIKKILAPGGTHP